MQTLPLDGVAEELGITAAEADAEDDSDFEDDAGALRIVKVQSKSYRCTQEYACALKACQQALLDDSSVAMFLLASAGEAEDADDEGAGAAGYQPEIAKVELPLHSLAPTDHTQTSAILDPRLSSDLRVE
jgi:hypothetical protein